MTTFSEDSAEVRLTREIMNFIRSQDLNFTAGDLTPADGNCFIHSVIQQLNRPLIAGDFPQLRTVNHQAFRHLVRDFMLGSIHPKVIEMKNYHHELKTGQSWAVYWEQMGKTNTWADQFFIQATAWFLQRDIMIITISNYNPIRYTRNTAHSET